MKNPRIPRWAILLGEYSCQIEYVSGRKNAVADMLSRLRNAPVAENLHDNEHLDWQGNNINNVQETPVNVVDNAVDISDDSDLDSDATPKLLDYHAFDEKELRLAHKRMMK